jgi:hypothetical protein
MHPTAASPRVTPWLAVAAALLLTACGAPPAPTVTVQGRLLMGPGVPVAGVLVHAQGRLVTSDGDGRFVLSGLTMPYTLTVASTTDQAWAHVFEGLSTVTPVLRPAVPQVPWAQPGARHTARITGATPNANPLPPGQRLEVCVEGMGAVVSGCDTVEAGGDAYELDALWWTPGGVDVRLHALHLQVDAEDRPTGVLGYGTLPLTLAANATLVRIAPSGPPPASVALQGSFALAGGGVLETLFVGVRVGDQGVVPLYLGPPSGATIGFVSPVLGPSRLHVAAQVTFPAGHGYGWAVVDPRASFGLALAAPPQPLAPADGATAVTAATPFTVLGDADRVYEFTWRQTGTVDGMSVRLLTRSTSVTLPDLTPVGLAWAAGGTYGWSVAAWSATSVDEAASLAVQGADLELLLAYGVGVDADGWIAGTSPRRAVTLAP